MGMFDYVTYTYDCPLCNKVLSEFQTKEKDCSMSHLDPKEVSHFYTYCDDCGAWVEFQKEDKCYYKDGDDNGIASNIYRMTATAGRDGHELYIGEVRI